MLRITQQVWRCAQLRGFTDVALALVVALAACEGAPARSKPWRHGGETGQAEPSAAVAARAQALARVRLDRDQRSAVRVAVTGPLDPSEAVGHWTTFGIVYEPLAALDNGVVRAHLAASIEVVDGGRAVQIDLRPGVLRHDGKPLSRLDVVSSLNRARRAGSPTASDLRDVVGIETPGPQRIRLRLRRPNFYIARVLAEVPIASARANKAGVRVGTGPMRPVAAEAKRPSVGPERPSVGAERPAVGAERPAVGARRPERPSVGPERPWVGPRWRFERFEEYWGAARAGGAAAIEVVAVASRADALAAVQVGDADLARHIRAQDRVTGGGVRAIAAKPAHFRYLAMNARRALFSDVEVRRAASLVVDRRALAADGHRGRARAIQAPAWPGGPISTPAAAVAARDRRRAEELLDRSGWLRTPAGARERDGQKLIAVAVTGAGIDRARDLVFDQLRESGFVLDVRRLSGDELAAALRKGEFDLAILEWRGHPDWDLSPLLETGGRLNLGRVSSRVLDDALAAMRVASTPGDRAASAASLVQVLDDVVPVAFLTAPIEVVAVGPALSGALEGQAAISLRAVSRRSQ